MLNHLRISNFALIESLALDFQPNLTVLTGETGAGKSIIIDALSLCLGARADFKQIRPGAEQCEISVEFDVSANSPAQHWLVENDLAAEEHSCIIVRILTHPGRSRCLINGRPCPAQQLRELGESLVDITSQHQHIALLQSKNQRELLDRYADNTSLHQELLTTYHDWQQLKQQIDHWHALSQNQSANQSLLEYHLEELTGLDLQPDEVNTLHAQFQQQQHAANGIQTCQQAMHILEHAENTPQSSLRTIINELQQAQRYFPSMDGAIDLLKQAQINMGEACQELSQTMQTISVDPEQLSLMEKRLNLIHDMARKHQVAPEGLLDKQSELETQLEALQQADHKLEQLMQQQAKLEANYLDLAKQLRSRRQQAAATLSHAVTEQLGQLGMQSGQFTIRVEPIASDTPTPHGLDTIEFWVATNPGQPAGPLAKVASGGELSRISLILSVLCGQQQTATQVFDEVDVGISGATAEVVGKLLKTLAEQRQILCITHLPQVAAQGNQHLQVSKTTENHKVSISVQPLTQQQRINEIARLLGGIEITKQTLDHAKAMCE